MSNPIDIVIDKIIKNTEGAGEGYSLAAYWDEYGKVWTIGYGCTGKGITKGTVWTRGYAEASLRQRLNQAHDTALRMSPILRTQSDNRQAAITDFIYNEGEGRYATSTLKIKIDAADWAAAQDQIVLWNKAGGRVLSGLVKRRAIDAALLAA